MLLLRSLKTRNLGPLDLELASGECVSLQGPSGSGKSLLLRAIADLDPSEGDIFLDGRSRSQVPAPQWRRKIGYVPAEPGWWASRVDQHFEAWHRASENLRTLSIPSDCGSWPISRLSTGERQRLGLIRALSKGPQVILLDEPTAALDPETTEAVEAIITERCRTDGLAAIWVTHREDQARRVAKRHFRIIGNGIVQA